MTDYITESYSYYDNLEAETTGQLLRAINDEDKKVALAVEKAIPQIVRFVDAALPRMQRGGGCFISAPAHRGVWV